MNSQVLTFVCVTLSVTLRLNQSCQHLLTEGFCPLTKQMLSTEPHPHHMLSTQLTLLRRLCRLSEHSTGFGEGARFTLTLTPREAVEGLWPGVASATPFRPGAVLWSALGWRVGLGHT